MVYRDIPHFIRKDRPAKEMVRNFSGTETRYNPAGRRSFNLALDPNVDGDLIDSLKVDGWNVRDKETRDGDPICYLQVFVDFTKEKFKPRIKMLRDSDLKGITINESNIALLDSAEIKQFDFNLRPYQWETSPTSSGVKAYLQSMNVIVEYDEVADRYENYKDTEEELPFL